MSMIEDDLIGVQKLPRSGSGDVSREFYLWPGNALTRNGTVVFIRARSIPVNHRQNKTTSEPARLSRNAAPCSSSDWKFFQR